MSKKPGFSGERVPFSEAFADVSRGVKKYKQKEYAEEGAHPIIDQGQEEIAGYSDEEEGLFTNVPAIVFGDHTRCVKYVERPFFAGADGVKILKPKMHGNPKYWWHALKATPIEDLGYSRHFKLLKAATFTAGDDTWQSEVVSRLDSILNQIAQAEKQIEELDSLVKSRFSEMFEANMSDGFVSLKECCSKIRGGKTPSMKHPEYYGGDIPFVKSGDIKQDRVSGGTLTLTPEAISGAGVKLIPKDSILVVTRSALLHRKMHSSINVREIAINQDIKAFIPLPDYLPSYLLWAIRSHEKELLAGVRSVSTCALDFQQLCSLRVKDVSLQKQNEFSDFASQVDKSRGIAQQQIEKLQTLYDSLAQEYFS